MPARGKAYSKNDLVNAIQQVVWEASPEKETEPHFLRLLRQHFGGDPRTLPVLEEEFAEWEHPTAHLALQKSLERADRPVQMHGFMGAHQGQHVSLADLLKTQWPPEPAPLAYRSVTLQDEILSCVQAGLFLFTRDKQPMALVFNGPTEHYYSKLVSVTVAAPRKEVCETFLADLRRTMRGLSVYRGKVLTLHCGDRGVSVHIQRLPHVEREQIILTSGLLDRIERQTVLFAKHAEKLRAVGQHLKRGILLYGPPGTGKTFSAMYLASRMKGRTVILLTGGGLGAIEQACAFARALQPSTVVLEDVDLVAQERTDQDTGTNAVLFQLLNQMDGLAEDADVLFLLTTNRPDVLEPALASRPGRIDTAIEVPLPDAECRRRLLSLYARGISLDLHGIESLVRRTEGVSAAFIRELVRKAALAAADEGGDLVVRDQHLDEALHELLIEGGGLTRNLLGATGNAATAA
jgi:hypothetical protein